MADNNDITDLYNALIDKEYSKVRRLCHAHPEYLLQKITIYNDTALHMIALSKQKGLVLDLLKILPADCNSQLSDIKNDDGNTILHKIATRDAMKDVAEELLNRNADLLTARNKLGEKPIFYAARYGQTEMFEFLADKMELAKLSPEESKPHLQRNDGTTVLHISIATECFHLSSSIVERYPYLIKEMDQSSMTAFQYLACNPTAFHKGKIQIRRGFIEYLNESKAHIKRSTTIQGFMKVLQELYSESFKRDMRKRETWLKVLVKHLVQNDDSWNNNISSNQLLVGLGECKEPNIEAKRDEQYPRESLKSNECPLFLATMSNIKEIVEEILQFQPHALKNTSKDGMNILHVAVLYRHTDIFDMVVTKFEVLARRLLLAKDNKGNSVLHMVSLKRKSQSSERMQSPALQLRNELLLFEVTPTYGLLSNQVLIPY